MSFDFYIVAYSVIVLVFVSVILLVSFSKYNNRVLKKSYIDTRLYIYIVFLSALLYVGAIFYSSNLNVVTNLTYIIFALIFLVYAFALMLTLLITLRPIRKIVDSTELLARGRKTLNADFEGAIEFDNIAKNLENVAKKYRENDKKLNKKDVEYQKFIAKEYLNFFGKSSIDDIEVGDFVQAKLCTLFCDMRNSYFSSETLSLSDNFEVIKDFIKLVSTNVKKYNGFIDKFMGDGVLAIFENEDDCLNAAIEIAKQLDYKNVVSIGKEPVKFGISLNSGMCVIGVVGSPKQKQFSVVSDVVNLCSRIESLNKLFGTRVLMTKIFLNNLKGNFNTRYIGTIEFDDLTSKIPVFESVDSYVDAKKLGIVKFLQEFESGVRLYEKGDFQKAKQFFTLCLKNDNTDALSRYYLSKVKQNVIKIEG